MDVSRPIALHIDKLVLDGFPPLDRHRVATAVEHELARLLAEQGVPARLGEPGATERLDAGSLAVLEGHDADAIGADIARALYGRLEGSGE